MRGFLSELDQFLGYDFCVARGCYRYVMLEDVACYIEGSFKILFFSDEEVCIRVKKSTLTVTGKNLCIKAMDGGSIFIQGKFLHVTRAAVQA